VRIIAASMLACSLVLGDAAIAETDVLLRAVGFALTGSDDAEPKIIGNPADCVFSITRTKSTSFTTDVFHLNNIHIDRIKVEGHENRLTNQRWLTLELHGDDTIFEETSQARDDGSDLMRALHEANPNLFKPSSQNYKEHELDLATDDADRVKRAWRYIYTHGCTGKQSPF
jgi:hypothetical protein